MSTGKAIFLIVVLLVGSFISLGYLIRQSMSQDNEIRMLEDQIRTLQAALDEATKKAEMDQNRIQDLEDQVKILEVEIAQANMAASQAIKDCGKTTLAQLQGGELRLPVPGNILLASSLVGLITGGGIYQIRSRRSRVIKQLFQKSAGSVPAFREPSSRPV
jgi:hypothetical protein